MTKRKNPAAQALGRIGGSRNTPAQQAARRKNAKKGGRPFDYRIVDDARSSSLTVWRRVDNEWRPLETFTPGALIQLASYLRATKPRMQVYTIDVDGTVRYRKGE